jgi:putative chitinase
MKEFLALLSNNELCDRLTNSQMAYVLATAFHETGGSFKPIVENLNYTTASRLRQVWPVRFADIRVAREYTNNPRKLANLVYGGRLGNDSIDDGYKYRGRGFVQITGKANYAKFSDIVMEDLVANPEIACTPNVATQILLFGMHSGLFTGKKLEDFINDGETDYVNARRIINGDVRLNGQAIAKIAIAYQAVLDKST